MAVALLLHFSFHFCVIAQLFTLVFIVSLLAYTNLLYSASTMVCYLVYLPELLSLFTTSLGSSLRHSEERYGDRRHVCDEAGAHHEVNHPRGHGGYYSHLRPGSSSADCQQHLREGHPLQVSSVDHSHIFTRLSRHFFYFNLSAHLTRQVFYSFSRKGLFKCF